jgi:membrane-associated protein
MQLIQFLFEFIKDPRPVLEAVIGPGGLLAYLLLFVVIFAETGLVVMPFLPGDSLLFAAGAMAGTGLLNPALTVLVILLGAFIGDNTNYWIGRTIGPKVMHDESRFFKKKYLDKTQGYFDKYGARTVVIARFVPIVRTFAPFMAGVGHMPYPRYMAYSFGGAIFWVGTFVGAGYFFGNLPFVEKNFTVAILIIIVLSVLPGAFEAARHRLMAWRAEREAARETAGE